MANVVITDVLEVPVSTRIRRNSLCRAVDCVADASFVERGRHAHRLGDIRERQALGRKADAAPPRIVERPPVGADAVIVADAGVDVKRQKTAAGGHGTQSVCGAAARTRIGEEGIAPRVRELRWGESEHRRLLVGLAVSADDGQRRAKVQTLERLRHFRRDSAPEDVVLPRIVHAREHQVLPHEEAELVADVVEVLGFVGHRAADADHVHAGIREQTQGVAMLERLGRESCDVQGRPADAATEDRGAVHDQPEPVAVGVAVEIDRAESDAPRSIVWSICPFRNACTS